MSREPKWIEHRNRTGIGEGHTTLLPCTDHCATFDQTTAHDSMPPLSWEPGYAEWHAERMRRVEVCWDCGGKGQVRFVNGGVHGNEAGWMECPTCEGTGVVYDRGQA